MPSKLKSYHDWLGAKLVDPKRAARYLNAAAEDSEAMFLKALRKVALSQDRSMTEIAESSGITRESLYRMLSETGNPTSENRRAILAVLGFKSVVVPIDAHADTTHIDSERASAPERPQAQPKTEIHTTAAEPWLQGQITKHALYDPNIFSSSGSTGGMSIGVVAGPGQNMSGLFVRNDKPTHSHLGELTN